MPAVLPNVFGSFFVLINLNHGNYEANNQFRNVQKFIKLIWVRFC
jgi:hypothetical protein